MIITSAEEVLFSSGLVGLYVRRITQKLPGISPRNMVEECGRGQERTILVLIWIRGGSRIIGCYVFFSLSLTLWHMVLFNIIIDFSENNLWILMKNNQTWSGLISMGVAIKCRSKSKSWSREYKCSFIRVQLGLGGCMCLVHKLQEVYIKKGIMFPFTKH